MKCDGGDDPPLAGLDHPVVVYHEESGGLDDRLGSDQVAPSSLVIRK